MDKKEVSKFFYEEFINEFFSSYSNIEDSEKSVLLKYVNYLYDRFLFSCKISDYSDEFNSSHMINAALLLDNFKYNKHQTICINGIDFMTKEFTYTNKNNAVVQDFRSLISMAENGLRVDKNNRPLKNFEPYTDEELYSKFSLVENLYFTYLIELAVKMSVIKRDIGLNVIIYTKDTRYDDYCNADDEALLNSLVNAAIEKCAEELDEILPYSNIKKNIDEVLRLLTHENNLDELFSNFMRSKHPEDWKKLIKSHKDVSSDTDNIFRLNEFLSDNPYLFEDNNQSIYATPEDNTQSIYGTADIGEIFQKSFGIDDFKAADYAIKYDEDFRNYMKNLKPGEKIDNDKYQYYIDVLRFRCFSDSQITSLLNIDHTKYDSDFYDEQFENDDYGDDDFFDDDDPQTDEEFDEFFKNYYEEYFTPSLNDNNISDKLCDMSIEEYLDDNPINYAYMYSYLFSKYFIIPFARYFRLIIPYYSCNYFIQEEMQQILLYRETCSGLKNRFDEDISIDEIADTQFCSPITCYYPTISNTRLFQKRGTWKNIEKTYGLTPEEAFNKFKG